MVGKTIHHYEILEELGRGGMGVVYKAQDTKLDRFVALKFLPQHLSQTEEKKRFIHEAKAASALDHPNLCTIYEIDETEDGQMFIAMAYYEGKSLHEIVGARHALPLPDIIDYAIQITAGLAKAHAKGIIHRDIKPANILITEDETVKIVDFGLAKLAGRSVLTKEGTTLGTTSYMSPEQTQGTEVDKRTDIWAFGVVLYEMITGKQPFAGDYEQAVMYSIMNEDPEPITGLRTGLPMELERIVNKCLAKDPSDRYQHVDELIVDLRHLREESAAGQPVSGKLSPTIFTKKTFPTLVWPGILLAAVVLVVAGYLFFSGPEAISTERIAIAVVDFVNETNEPELDGLSGMLITALEHSRRLSVLTRGRMFDILDQLQKGDVTRIDERLGKEICEQVGINLMVVASIRKFGQTYAVDLKLLDHQKNEYLVTAKAEARGQESIPDLIDKLAEETRKGLKEREAEIQATSRKTATVTTLNLEAYQHFFKGEELLNKIQEEEAVAEFQKAIALDSTFGLAYYRLGYTLHFFSRAGEMDEARTALSQALALLDRMPEKEQYIARAYLAHLGHTPKELAAGLAILREMEKLYPEDKELIFFIGDWSYHNVQFETAREYLERVLTLDPDFRRALMHLFLTYRDMGNYQGALKVAKHMQNLTNGDGLSYLMLGTAYGRLAQYENAVINLKKALTVSRDLDLYRELGYVYFQQDSLEQAKRILGQALEFEQTDIWSKYLLANVLVKQNQPSRAEAFARKFAAENPGFHGENLLAWVLVAANIDFDEAVLFAEKAMSDKPLRYPDRLRAIPYYPLPEHTLGLAYLQMREYRRAVEFLEVAEQLAPLRENIKNDLQAAQRQLRLESNK